ncbi:MAG: LD-carboxypeptidase [Ferruginibacter sp.]|nr:LD-carboxypeptidase [Ferruginibacter sp.]
MNRKNFLSSVVPLAATFTAVPSFVPADNGSRIPPYLSNGDIIGITCPAGFITHDEITPALKKLTEWGFQYRIGATVGKRDFTFGGTDAERASDFQQLLDDDTIKGILCARGGYGMVRILDQLDFTKFKRNPKWIIGFSDITVMHSHLQANFGIASLHSKMCNSFPDDWEKAEPVQKETIESIRKCLKGEHMSYPFSPSARNKNGEATGLLMGGNLKTLESLAGSKSDLLTKDALLFVEDTGEYLYSIDRMFWNLKRTGKLSKLKGLIIGGFKIKKDDEGEEFGKSLQDIVLEKVAEYNYPVCFDFPVGHQKNNFALKCGVKHTLQITTNSCSLKESR